MRSIAIGVVMLVAWAACSLRSTDDLQRPSAGGAATTTPSSSSVGGAGGSGGCAAPMADCDGDGSCETNLADDRMHCGACDYPCNGIACEDGSCLLDRLGAGLLGWQIAIDDTDAYITSTGVVVVPLDGSRSWDNFSISSPNPFGIYVDDDYVWWVGQNLVSNPPAMWEAALWRKARGATAADTDELVWSDGDPQPTKVAGTIAGTDLTVAWSSGTTAATQVHGVPKTSLSMVLDIALAEAPVSGMATTPQLQMVWTNSDGDLTYWSIPETVDLATQLERPFDVVLSGTDAYYVLMGADETTPQPNGSLARISWSPPTSNAQPETLVTDLAEPVAVVLDNTHVYFSESSLDSDVIGTVKRLDRATLSVDTLARAKSQDDFVGDLDMHGDTIAWVVVIGGSPAVTEVWKRSKKAYALPP